MANDGQFVSHALPSWRSSSMMWRVFISVYSLIALHYYPSEIPEFIPENGHFWIILYINSISTKAHHLLDIIVKMRLLYIHRNTCITCWLLTNSMCRRFEWHSINSWHLTATVPHRNPSPSNLISDFAHICTRVTVYSVYILIEMRRWQMPMHIQTFVRSSNDEIYSEHICHTLSKQPTIPGYLYYSVMYITTASNQSHEGSIDCWLTTTTTSRPLLLRWQQLMQIPTEHIALRYEIRLVTSFRLMLACACLYCAVCYAYSIDWTSLGSVCGR